MRISVRVRPGASRTLVGGEHDGALVIKVSLASGATSRTKLVDVPDAAASALDELRSAR